MTSRAPLHLYHFIEQVNADLLNCKLLYSGTNSVLYALNAAATGSIQKGEQAYPYRTGLPVFWYATGKVPTVITTRPGLNIEAVIEESRHIQPELLYDILSVRFIYTQCSV